MHINDPYSTIIYSVDSKVATILLNRPKALNAINKQLRDELHHALDKAAADPAISLLVISGNGSIFSAGTDLTEPMSSKGGTLEQWINEEYKPLLLAIHEMPKIVISAINGLATGVGGALAMACDLTVMAEDAAIYQAFSLLGAAPDGGTAWQLVNTLGYKKALEVIIEAKRISAEQCLVYGLANRVVPATELMSETLAWAQQLASGAPLSQRATKQALQFAMQGSFADTISFEAKLQDQCSQSRDCQEAVSAFKEKRKPVFNGT